MPPARRLAVVLAFATALVAAGPPRHNLAAPSPNGPRPNVAQWVWTRADAALVDEDARVGVFVGTVHGGETLRWKRALSPHIGLRSAQPRAAVIRFDDDLHPHWDDPGFDLELTRQLERVLAELGGVHEIQLDYDAPRRRLGAWGALVRRWSAGPLADRSVWVTSIPSHLGSPDDYRRAFAGAVDGHILQVFDTGLACTPSHAHDLARRIAAATIPYRVGVGAFERGDKTDHGCWLRQWRHLARPTGFDGLWVFPAGHAYRHLINP